MYSDNDRVECSKTSLINYGSRLNPKVGDVFTLKEFISDVEYLHDKTIKFYSLIDNNGNELPYPYKDYELNLFFKKI